MDDLENPPNDVTAAEPSESILQLIDRLEKIVDRLLPG